MRTCQALGAVCLVVAADFCEAKSWIGGGLLLSSDSRGVARPHAVAVLDRQAD